MSLSPPRIVCAAVRYLDGKMLVAPRHFDSIMHAQYAAFGITNTEDHSVQGFVDQHCNFYTRQEAYVIAEANGQIRRRVGGDEGKLFSENLY